MLVRDRSVASRSTGLVVSGGFAGRTGPSGPLQFYPSGAAGETVRQSRCWADRLFDRAPRKIKVLAIALSVSVCITYKQTDLE